MAADDQGTRQVTVTAAGRVSGTSPVETPEERLMHQARDVTSEIHLQHGLLNNFLPGTAPIHSGVIRGVCHRMSPGNPEKIAAAKCDPGNEALQDL